MMHIFLIPASITNFMHVSEQRTYAGIGNK
jgi:hypothetical protein